jgi:hypothetical protein
MIEFKGDGMYQQRQSSLQLAIALLVAVLFGATAVSGQTINTNVSGTIKDQAGAAVPGAKVTLIDLSTKRETTATSNDQGFFTFSDVRAGNYQVTAERDGFRKTSVEGVVVNVGVPATVNLTLSAGQIVDVVTTTASDAQLVVNTENAKLQTTVLERQINDLPLNGRNPLDLANLQAGVNQSGDNREASVNGLRGTFTNLTWDGININDNYIRTDTFFGVAAPSVVSVSEFTVTTQNTGADDALGVTQVKLVTPRGSSKFHGNLFNFHRNDFFDANSFFNNATGLPRERLVRNQFGAGVGGPIKAPGSPSWIKDKLFFYGYYEGTRERTEESLLRTVLTSTARTGQFTYRRADNGQLRTINLLQLAGGSLDPLTQRLVGLTPLPNDLASGDLANVTGGLNLSNTAGFRFNTSAANDSDLWGFRIDYDASARHRFEASFSRFTFKLPNDPFNGLEEPFPGLPGGGQSSARPRGSFAWSWTPTNSLTNELRAGFNHYNVTFNLNEKFADGIRVAFPLIDNPVQNSLNQGRNVQNYELIDNATWVKGNHQIRFGANFRRIYLTPFNFAGVLPLYTLGFNSDGNVNPLDTNLFPGGISDNDFNRASDILAILTGTVAQATQTFNAGGRTAFTPGEAQRQQFLYYSASGYGSDTWRIRPNLSLNVGLRYEYVSPPTERRGLLLLPVGGLDALRNPNATFDFAGRGTGRSIFNPDRNNFAPSIGFSWDPFKDGKTAIRGGYSISYVIDNNITTIENAALGNDGLSQTVTLPDVAGRISGAGRVRITTPLFKVPRTISDNMALDPTSAIFTVDPNLQVPYVQQWALSVEREILPNTVFEARYVGNRGTKLTRAIDINQLSVVSNGFLEDFRRAQRNLAANGNPAVGEALQIFPKLGDFRPFGLGFAFLNDPSIRNLIRTGQVGELANIYVVNRDLFLDPNNGFGVTLTPGFFLRANPNAYVADYVGNGSYSAYHGLQLEVRRRLNNGLYFQGNYTFSKGFTDFEGGQTNFQGLLDLGSTVAVEKQRISNDITHVFKANSVYDLPFGPGKRFLDGGGWAGRFIGGWSLNGILRLQSGEPISIVSARGTLNRAGRSVKNTVNSTLSVSELQSRTGLYRDSQGRPVLFDPSLIGSDGRASTQFFSNPAAGSLGLLQLTPVSGPWFFNVDMSLIKRTSITERMNIEFRADAFNIFNRTNFDVGQVQNINATTFGRITGTFDPRILQFALKLNF